MKKYKPIAKMGGILCNSCRKVIKYPQTEDEAQGKCGPVLCDSCLEKLVYNYKTKYKEGFTHLEMKDLLIRFPTINKTKFFNALKGNTCMILGKHVITYHCDIITALKCGLENRNIKYHEWD